MVGFWQLIHQDYSNHVSAMYQMLPIPHQYLTRMEWKSGSYYSHLIEKPEHPPPPSSKKSLHLEFCTVWFLSRRPPLSRGFGLFPQFRNILHLNWFPSLTPNPLVGPSCVQLVRYFYTCLIAYLYTCILICLHTCIPAYLHTCIKAYLHNYKLTWLHTFKDT